MRHPSATPRLVPALGMAGLALIAGCGTGMRAETYQERTVADATNDAVGSIAVRNLAVKAPAQGTVHRQGSTAPVTITLVNDSAQPDQLVGAQTPAAESVQVVGPSSTLQVPPLGPADPGYSLNLVGLTRDLPTGSFIPLTLTFQRNGAKTLLVPVQVSPQNVPRQDRDYEVAETDSAGHPIVRPSAGRNSPDVTSEPQGDTGAKTPTGG